MHIQTDGRNDLVCIEKLDTFKNRLDVLWRGKRFDIGNIY